MQNGGPDYKKLYEESLERLARAEAQHQRQSLQYQQQAKDYQQQIGQYEQEFIILKHELNQLRRRVFGITSDNQVKKAIEAGQLDLFNLNAPANAVQASEALLSAEIKENNAAQDKKSQGRASASRMALPDHLETEEVIIDPQADLKEYHVIGQEVTEILVHEPERFKIKRIIRRKWALNNPGDIEHTGVLIAPIPSRTVKRGLFDESVLTHLLISKYVDHLPLHRLRMMFGRQDINIAASTLSECGSGRRGP